MQLSTSGCLSRNLSFHIIVYVSPRRGQQPPPQHAPLSRLAQLSISIHAGGSVTCSSNYVASGIVSFDILVYVILRRRPTTPGIWIVVAYL
jgi:hypothetical protein